MANLFKTNRKLVQLNNDNNFNETQKAFILKIIEGNSLWSPLESLASTINVVQLNNLKAALKDEINASHYLWDYKYISTLKSVLTDVQGTLDQLDLLKTYSTKKKEEYNKFAKKMDVLYRKTTQAYHGTIMMPVNQALEPRIGNSNGECFGYVAQWATQILKKERPFGLGVNQLQILQPILFNSALARKHPEINHLAVLTKEISIYQELQSSVEELVTKLSNSKITPNKSVIDEHIDYNQNSDSTFYKTTSEIAQALVNEAKKDSSKIYNLNIFTYIGGHALGFCLIDNKYHFFDSNSGWYRFDNDKDFINWFAYYYKQRGYESYYFNEYAISSYSLVSSSNKATESKKPLSWDLGTIAILTILAPFLIIYVLGMLTNMFIVRGFRYLGIMINEYFKSDNQLEEINFDDNPPLVEPPPKSLEFLDLAVNLDKPNEKLPQSKRVSDYLDLAVGADFKHTASHSFFKESNVAKPRIEIEAETLQYGP